MLYGLVKVINLFSFYFRSCSSTELPGRFPSASLTNRRTSAVIRTQAKAASLASDGRRCCWHWRSPGVCSWTIKPWPNDTPNSSQLEPSQSQCRWNWVSFVHPLASRWLELACIWPSSNFRPTRVKFPPFGQLKPTLAKLFCYCYVTTRSYSDNWMVSCELARLGSTVWPPADASFDFLTWLELAWVGSTVWPGL